LELRVCLGEEVLVGVTGVRVVLRWVRMGVGAGRLRRMLGAEVDVREAGVFVCRHRDATHVCVEVL
jgi:hypothetical protein